jgi:hypothetical protein
MKTPSKLFDTCNDHYTRTFDEVQTKKSVLISYFGDFSQTRVNHLLEKMESSLAMLNESKRSGKRVFSITVEGLQNIKLHGNKTADGQLLGLFMLSYNKKEYDIRFANLVSESGKDHLLNEIEKINKMSSEVLRDYHKEVLFNGDISSKGGAGLGLIITAMKSSAKLEPDFIKLADDLYFYNLYVSVDCGL